MKSRACMAEQPKHRIQGDCPQMPAPQRRSERAPIQEFTRSKMPWRSRSQLWLCLVLGGAFGAMRPATAGSLRPVSEPVPPNYILGTF